jgi:hypothetical protein
MALTNPLYKDPYDVIDWAALGSFSKPLGGPLAVIKKVRGKWHKLEREKS